MPVQDWMLHFNPAWMQPIVLARSPRGELGAIVSFLLPQRSLSMQPFFFSRAVWMATYIKPGVIPQAQTGGRMEQK